MKNSDLFKDLPTLEATFFHPEEYPWQTLMRVLDFLKQNASTHAWLEEGFSVCSFNEAAKKGMKLSSRGIIESEVNIRGSAEEFTMDPESYMKGPIYLGKGERA